MSRESDFYTRMVADTALMLILTGGVYKSENVGIEGINLDTTSAAFDATTQYLKPCALCKQRPRVPDRMIADSLAQIASVVQTVEIYIYQEAIAGANSYSAIDAAVARLYVLFHGVPFADSYPVEYTNLIDRMRDTGALRGRSMGKMDFQVRSIWQP